jgi:hypothetical protein
MSSVTFIVLVSADQGSAGFFKDTDFKLGTEIKYMPSFRLANSSPLFVILIKEVEAK